MSGTRFRCHAAVGGRPTALSTRPLAWEAIASPARGTPILAGRRELPTLSGLAKCSDLNPLEWITRIDGRYGPQRVLGLVDNRNSAGVRSEEHTSELQSRVDVVCRLL